MWLIFALLSAVFAALTSILAKVGIEGVNSNLATAIRTVVVVIMAWGMVFLTHAQNGISDKRPERNFRYREKKLAVPDPVGSGDGRIMAVLLPGTAAGRGVEGGAD